MIYDEAAAGLCLSSEKTRQIDSQESDSAAGFGAASGEDFGAESVEILMFPMVNQLHVDVFRFFLIKLRNIL